MLMRVSNVEAFRRWRENEESTVEDFVRYITVDEPSDAMKAGTAFHRCLELAQDGDEFSVLCTDGYQFVIECDVELEVAPVRELRLAKDYGAITITGQVDALFGIRIDDHKTTARFDPENYLGGAQWKFYLDIFDADVFRWNVFEMDFDRVASNGDRVYRVFGFHQLEQVRYPSLHQDCARLAADFYAFASEQLPELRSAA
jgi:hypothetical protein